MLFDLQLVVKKIERQELFFFLEQALFTLVSVQRVSLLQHSLQDCINVLLVHDGGFLQWPQL